MDALQKAIVGIALSLLLGGGLIAGDVRMAPGKEKFAADFLSMKLEKMQLQNATPQDAISYIFLTANSKIKDGYKGGYAGTLLGKPISASLANATVQEALILITDRAELEWKFDGRRFCFWPRGESEPPDLP